MSIRLPKIAKELNVATSTIVEFLNDNGFEIENKPTTKVSEEMYNALVSEFSNSMNIKEKADQLVIGNRPKEEVKKPLFETKVEPIPPPTPEPTPEVVKEEVIEEVKEEIAEVVEKPASPVEEIVRVEVDKPKLKVIGKIDLNKEKEVKPKVEKEVVEEIPAAAKETKKEEEPVKEKKAKSDKKTEAPVKGEAAAPEEDPNMMKRIVAPQLQGLKILGKIDTKKFEKKKPEKKTDSAANKGNAANKKPKRKRTRKKISTQTFVKKDQKGSSKGRKSDEIPVVSQKEIEEKIKATMARISGGGKNKRQKIRRDNRDVKREKQEQIQLEKSDEVLKLTEFISVSEFASIMNVSVSEVITKCMNLGVIVSINQRLDAEIIELVANEFGNEIEFINVDEQEEDEVIEEDDPKDLEPRSPIVTVMGHVDHGKTSLLDYIREAKVADGEAGGITQHIGAYEVVVGKDNKKVTFLDTPGHEAFTAMRARGAKVTDIVIVIISADDRIMPQTKEAISHAQAAGVPIIFAINKIDKDGADPERVKKDLAEMNLLVEEWGGKYQSQDISAKTGANIDLLLEKVVLEAEILELKANPNKLALGTVVEASLDKGRGYVTKLLVQAGTLKIGDILLTGEHFGKVKAMFNEYGKPVKTAGPSAPVMILGLSGAPQAGEKFKVMETQQEAQSLANKRNQISREVSNRASKRISLDEIGRRLALGTFKELNLIVKGDVDGSVEALSDSLIKLSQETVAVNVIHKAVGQIVESDILLASASDAIIVGFQVRPSLSARQLAEKEGVEIKMYSIIYKAIDEISSAIEGMLEPNKEESITGQVEVRETYKISKIGTIAGCQVIEGTISRNSFVRIIRGGIVTYPTKEGAYAELASLKRFKDDVKEVKNGFECGITLKGYNDIKVGDIIEAFEILEIKQKLS